MYNWRYTACHTPFTSCIYYIRFWTVILAIWWVLDLFCSRHLVALSYWGKVTKAFPITPSGLKWRIKMSVWGLFLPPPPISNTRFTLWSRDTGINYTRCTDFRSSNMWRSNFVVLRTSFKPDLALRTYTFLNVTLSWLAVIAYNILAQKPVTRADERRT